MRSKSYLATLMLAAVFLLSVGTVEAAPMLHNFDCAECHKSGVVWTEVGQDQNVPGANICLQCHGTDLDTGRTMSDIFDWGNPADWTDDTFTPDPDSGATLTSGFASGDASNELGSNASPGNETSHNWGARLDNPRAGAAVNPADPMYNSTTAVRNASGRHVTCFRCHDPHGVKQVPNPGDNKLLRTPGYTDQDPATMIPTPANVEATCVVCHADWASVTQAENALESHPIVSDYPTFQAANSDRFNAWDPGNTHGDMQLLNGDADMGCTTCHGLHFTDSNSSTTDGPGLAAAGDGALLRGDGLAVNQSNICQTCHKHQNHPSSGGEPIGCLVCHSGHSYNNGTPNYYVLRSDVNTTTFGAQTGLLYDDLAKPIGELYAGPNGNDGYCTGCHGDFNDVGSPVNAVEDHTASDHSVCSTCHNHFDPANPTDPSFAGKGCTGCHGYPPVQNIAGGDPNAGYASDPFGTTHDYNTNNGTATFKDESQTPHGTHAASNPVMANIDCKVCHNAHLDDFNGQHNNATTGPTFQNVLEGAYTIPAITSAGGILSPGYNTTAPGTCSAVYCHSNGGKYTGAAKVPADYNAVDVDWENGINTITGCASCHGNDPTSMNSANRDNSPTHIAHLNKGYTCNVCHNQTIDSSGGDNNTVVNIGGGQHVDGQVDLDIDTTYELSVGNTLGAGSLSGASCSVYCHSNGKGTNSSPDWAVPGSGACGTCHAIDSTLPGSHAVHFAASGPNITDCSVCHTHDGTAGHVNAADHVDGNFDVTTGACLGCHGAVASGTNEDAEPTWGNPATVTCETCHVGTLSTLPAADTKYLVDVTAPAKDSFASLGHGSVATPQACTDCHDATDIGHFDLNSGDDLRLLTLGATTYGTGTETAWCQECHTGINAHYDNTQTAGGSSTDGNNCYVCHEPHGEGMGTNTDVMLIVGSNFTDKTLRDSYWNPGPAFDGVCQVCHDPAEVLYFNQSLESDTTHNSGQVCTDCHTHNNTPAFKGAATSCAGCHADEMAANGHPAHVQKNGGIIEDDTTDCQACHGAAVASYTLTGGHANHQNGSTDFAAGIGDGGSAPNYTCTSACHSSTLADGSWTDADGLNCNACHANPPVGGGDGTAHDDHVAAGFNCDTCHVAVPTDTTHIDDFALGVDNEGQVLVDMADAQSDEANVVVSTWDDLNNTCANTACHNPSGDSHLADWDTSVSSCTLCHNNDVASGTPMATGSHQQHVNNAAIIGDNAVCTDCHTSPAGNMAHRNGSLDTIAGVSYNGNNFGGGAYGTCTGSCHSDPTDPIASPVWNAFVDPTTVCGICHNSPQLTGDHTNHWIASRVANGLECASCHNDTVNPNADPLNTLTTIKAGGKHIDGGFYDVAAGGSYNATAVSITYTQGAPSNCTANCHIVNPKDWVPATGCSTCHGDLSYVGSTHTAHINITGTIEADVSECVVCHGNDINTYTITGSDGGSGNHQNSSIELAAGISNTTCAAACHDSSAGDGNWADADGLNCTACHNNGTNDNVLANAAPSTGAHDAHVATQGMTCVDCHGTLPTDTTHASGLNAAGAAGADQGETLTNRATPVADNATVNDSPFNDSGNSFDDLNNTCSNAYCHDPSNNNVLADWDAGLTADCNFCHGYDRTSAAVMNTGSHSAHLNAITTFGLTTLEDCLACHPDNTGNNGHFISGTGPTTVNGACQIAGTVIDGTTYTYSADTTLPPGPATLGSCGTNTCHNDGNGGAPPAYTWASSYNNCNTCHSERPTTGAHNIHTGPTAYGPHPTGSTDCSECHAANANNTSMAGQTTHISGNRDFNDASSVANHGGIFGAGSGVVGDTTITTCNLCHGGQTAADLAKNNWPSAAAVGCESCHGDYNLAQVSGNTAPDRAGTEYDTYGHGKASTPASAIGGSKVVNQACTDCHDSTVQHITGGAVNGNRLLNVGGNDYAVDPEAFCNACHTGVANSAVHYANTQTGGGTSDDATSCVTCHDQHGHGLQDAMVGATVAGNTVAGFADRTTRGSFANGSNNGICQVCHDPAEVLHFNRTTEELATHNSGSNCLACHNHTTDPIFKPTGCAGCHGGGTTGATASNYWPDATGGENDAGEHVKHMTVLAAVVYDQTLTQLLDDATSDVKQKALCEYCHAANTNDSNHAGTLNDAEVFVDADLTRHAKNLWGGNDLNATYTALSDTCSNVDCHNSQTTTATYSWYATPGADNNDDCVMCHSLDVANLGSVSNPGTGLHVVTTDTGIVQEHNTNLDNGATAGISGCEECHVKPAFSSTSTHVDGSFTAESDINNDRFLRADVNFTEAVINQSSCMPSGTLSACHSDGGTWSRLWSREADSTTETVGQNRCDVCHGQLGNWRTGFNDAAQTTAPDHNLTAINNGTHDTCRTCHQNPDAPYVWATNHEDGFIQINVNGVTYTDTTGTCAVFCHGAPNTRTMGDSTKWNHDPIIGNPPNCGTCHFDTGGGPTGVSIAGYTFTGVGSHSKHNTIPASSYGSTGLSSSATQYNYGCGNCHPIDSGTYHINGTLDLTLNSTHGGPIKSNNNVANDTSGYSQTNGSNVTCSAAWCHSDGAGTFATTPNWWGGAFTDLNANDYCRQCHENQPTSTSHQVHAVGIHYNDIYTGSTGLLADAAASNGGHGDVATAVTINCNLCHNSTVTQWRNDNNTACNSCHNGEGNEITSTDADLKKNFHVNGVKDVAFSPVDPLRSKAQVRDFGATEPELNDNWTRVNGYKAGATSHDASKNSPPLNASMWDGTNCTVVCHNGNTIAWGAAAVSCDNCHTQLPK